MFRDDEFRDLSKNEFDRQNITGENRESEKANTPVRVLTATSIIGDKVENTQGEKLGKINNIMLDLQNGCIEYVVLEFGGFLGVGEKLFALPFKSLHLNAERKTFILNLDKEFLEKAPGFDKDHWPETNSRHWNDVNDYWNDYNRTYPAGNTII